MSPDTKHGPPRRLVLPIAGSERAIPAAEPAPAATLDIEQVRHILPQLIDALSDAVLVVDRDRRVVAANRRYQQTFGLARPDAVGVLCHEAVHCPEADEIRRGGSCAACEVMELKESRRLLRALPDATGAVRRWEVTLNPVLRADGQVTHVVEVWRDITLRTQLEAQLSHSERLAALGILAAGVAHEINNPMASIVAAAESLRRWLGRTAGSRDPAAEEEARELLEILERETQRSRETTDKLLMLAQPYTVAPGWVDVNRAARDTLALLTYQVRNQRVRTIEDLESELPAIWAREGGIRGVLMNLCMNAVQAMPEGGALTVRTKRREGRVIIEVEDTGTGISPEHLERIWDPFFTTKPVGSGTGLGLSITQRIVSRHDGSIRVESAPGQGARFIIELPVAGSGGDHV